MCAQAKGLQEPRRGQEEEPAVLAVGRQRALWSSLGSDATSLHDFVQVSKPQLPCM